MAITRVFSFITRENYFVLLINPFTTKKVEKRQKKKKEKRNAYREPQICRVWEEDAAFRIDVLYRNQI